MVKRDSIIRRGKPEDAQNFSNLMIMSGKLLSRLYGKKSDLLMQYLFKHPQNIYSHEHTYFAEADGKIAGMLLGYTREDNLSQQQRTRDLTIGFLKIRYLLSISNMMKVYKNMGGLLEDEYLISNIAVYPEYRKKGFGKMLVDKAKRLAKGRRKYRLVLDVMVDNKTAISFYTNVGFVVENVRPTFQVNKKSFEYYKMSLKIQ